MVNFNKKTNRLNTNTVKFGMRKEFFGNENVLPMWVADMDFDAPKEISEAILERSKHSIYGYTFRNDSFFESIVNWLYSQHNWSIKQDQIEFTQGVLSGIVTAIHEFTKPNDKIIIQTPVYHPFYSIIHENKRQVVKNPLINTNNYYTIDFDNLEKVASDEDTKMMILCSPHNPVSREWKRDELGKIVEICERNNVMIVSDEIHSDLSLFGNKHLSIANEFESYAHNIITCMAPSKTFNIAGFGSSYAIFCNKDLKERFKQRTMALQSGMGNIFGNIALEAAYTHGAEWLRELKVYLEDNAMFVKNFIDTNMPEVGFVLPEATYLLWLDFRAWNISATKLTYELIHTGEIGMNDGKIFGKEGLGFQRLNIGTQKDVVKDAMERILKTRNSILK